MAKICLFLLLYVGQTFAQVFEKYEGEGLNEVRLHYVVTNSLLGAMAGATIAGSNSGLISGSNSLKIPLGVGGAVVGAAITGYLTYPSKTKLSNGYEKVFFTIADGFIGAVVLGFTTGLLADAVFPQTGDLPVSAAIGTLVGGLGGGILGGVYGYKFAIRF